MSAQTMDAQTMNAKVSRVRLHALPGIATSVELFTHPPEADLVSRKLHDTRAWEPFESRLWLAAHRPGDVVVDVGANLGYYSLLSALGPSPTERIFAFEPAADNYRLLCKNIALNGCEDRVTAVAAALGERDESIDLHRNEDNLGDHQVYAGDGERETEPVVIHRGADFLGAQVDRIDLMKIDTQGSELAVLRGLKPMLTASRENLRMLIELTPFSLDLAGGSGRALIELLEALALPLAIVDHVNHELVPSDAEALARWCDNVSATSGDRGFMNIFAGDLPGLS